MYMFLVFPDPPISRSLTFLSKTEFLYKWDPPQQSVTDGIKGYNITSNCGNCTPTGIVTVDNTTYSAMCSGLLSTGQSCQFKISTVTTDCGLNSEPADLHTGLNGNYIIISLSLSSMHGNYIYMYGISLNRMHSRLI